MVEIAGGIPFISFTSAATGEGGRSWGRMYHFFQYKREEYLAHYHKRSNVESTFSMMKRKFGDSLRSKTDVAMVNETLCKVLCHNTFWAGWADAHKSGLTLPFLDKASNVPACYGPRTPLKPSWWVWRL